MTDPIGTGPLRHQLERRRLIRAVAGRLQRSSLSISFRPPWATGSDDRSNPLSATPRRRSQMLGAAAQGGLSEPSR